MIALSNKAVLTLVAIYIVMVGFYSSHFLTLTIVPCSYLRCICVSTSCLTMFRCDIKFAAPDLYSTTNVIQLSILCMF